MIDVMERTDSSPEAQAAAWFVRLRPDHVSASERERFQRWLDADPAHAEAFAAYETLWDDMQEAAADDVIVAMRKEALALGPEPRRSVWPRLAALAAALAVFLLAGSLLLRTPLLPQEEAGGSPLERIAGLGQPEIYRTAVGQRSTLTLSDGSVVELNTDSVLQVRYGEQERNVRLLRGQAIFEVAHDASRPFAVEAEGQRITALGTSFDVRVASGEVRVTLLDGRVRVERVENGSEAPQRAARILEPGEQLLASVREPFVVRSTDVVQAVSWRTGRVIFTDEPLGDVLEEINRYTNRKVVLADPSLADLRISGVFRAGSVDGFVTALDTAFPVESRLDPARDEIVLSWR